MSLIGKILGTERDTFGLDVGFQSIKAVLLHGSGSHFRLSKFGISSSIDKPFRPDGIKEKKKLAEGIQKAIKDARIRTSGIVSALPESSVFTKVIQVPKMTAAELSQAVPLEANSFIPMEPDQIFLDFQIVGQSQVNLEVLVVAVPKKLVLDYIETIKLAGLELVCLETKPLANVRSLISPQENQEYLVLDLGAQTTCLTICKMGEVKFTATFDTGGNILTKKISASLSINLAKAEQLKREIGIGSDHSQMGDRLQKILKEPLSSLITEIGAGIKYYQSHTPRSKISKIILSGGNAAMPGLIKLIEDEIGIQTEMGNPWKNIVNPPKEQKSLQFATAIGLAMRRI